MNPMIKKVIAALAIKEGIDRVQEMRRPKPSLWSRISPIALVAALGGALFYLNKSGKLGPVLGGVKEKVAGGSSNGSGTWDSSSPASTSSTTSPTKTGV